MTEYLPKEIRDGLEAARRLARRKEGRMRLHAGDRVVPLLRYWEDGFAVEAERARQLRGLVDLYDGATHIGQCLIVATEEGPEETVFEFKRRAGTDHQPLDFARPEHAPKGLLPKG